MFGGDTYTPYNRDETWAYDYNSNSWTMMEPAVNPGPLSRSAITYSAAADQVILFGGDSEGKLSAETWSYDFNSDTWEDMTTRE